MSLVGSGITRDQAALQGDTGAPLIENAAIAAGAVAGEGAVAQRQHALVEDSAANKPV
jgi:hypothetical protein